MRCSAGACSPVAEQSGRLPDFNQVKLQPVFTFTQCSKSERLVAENAVANYPIRRCRDSRPRRISFPPAALLEHPDTTLLVIIVIEKTEGAPFRGPPLLIILPDSNSAPRGGV